MKAILLITLISIILISGCAPPNNENSITNEAITVAHDNFSVEETFKVNVVALSSEICAINKTDKTDYFKFMDNRENNISKVIYGGILISNRLGANIFQSKTKSFEWIYKLRIAEEYKNKLVEEWNEMLPNACSINENSSRSELEEISRDIGEFSGKTFYLFLRAQNIEPSKAILVLIEKTNIISTTDKNIKFKIFSFFGEWGVNAYERTIFETKKATSKGLKKADETLYDKFGEVFRKSAPEILKTEIVTRHELKTKYIPETKKALQEFTIEIIDEFS